MNGDGRRGRCSVSVVISTHNEGSELGRTVASLQRGLGPDAEIVIVDDRSTDESVSSRLLHIGGVRILRSEIRLGVAHARNTGAQAAGGDVLFFCDAHLRAPEDWLAPLLRVLDGAEVGAVAPAIARMRYPAVRGYGLRFVDWATNTEWLPQLATYPYPVPAVGGFFVGIRREVFDTVGGFDGGMRVYGMEDPELCVRLWTFGYRCMVVPAVAVRHVFRVTGHQLNWDTGLHNILRFGVVHFGRDRLRRLIDHYADDPAFPRAFAALAIGSAWDRRAWNFRRRVHDDDWYFDRLSPSLLAQHA